MTGTAKRVGIFAAAGAVVGGMLFGTRFGAALGAGVAGAVGASPDLVERIGLPRWLVTDRRTERLAEAVAGGQRGREFRVVNADGVEVVTP